MRAVAEVEMTTHPFFKLEDAIFVCGEDLIFYEGLQWTPVQRREMKVQQARAFLASIAARHPEWTIRKARS